MVATTILRANPMTKRAKTHEMTVTMDNLDRRHAALGVQGCSCSTYSWAGLCTGTCYLPMAGDGGDVEEGGKRRRPATVHPHVFPRAFST